MPEGRRAEGREGSHLELLAIFVGSLANRRLDQDNIAGHVARKTQNQTTEQMKRQQRRAEIRNNPLEALYPTDLFTNTPTNTSPR